MRRIAATRSRPRGGGIRFGEFAVERREKLDAGSMLQRTRSGRRRARVRRVACRRRRRAPACPCRDTRARACRRPWSSNGSAPASRSPVRADSCASSPVEHHDVDRVVGLRSHGSLRFGTSSASALRTRLQRCGRQLDLAAHLVATVPARASRRLAVEVDDDGVIVRHRCPCRSAARRDRRVRGSSASARRRRARRGPANRTTSRTARHRPASASPTARRRVPRPGFCCP